MAGFYEHCEAHSSYEKEMELLDPVNIWAWGGEIFRCLMCKIYIRTYLPIGSSASYLR
jgi:hypothetical protein